VTWKDQIDIKMKNNANINNYGTFDIQTWWSILDDGEAGNFNNFGTLQKTAGGGQAKTRPNYVHEAGAHINITDGQLLLQNSAGGVHFPSGTINLAPGTKLSFATGFEQDGGTATVASGATLDVAGAFSFNGGTIDVNGGTLLGEGDFDQSGGTLTAEVGAHLTVQGASCKPRATTPSLTAAPSSASPAPWSRTAAP
jgi:hypothetical protein